MILNIVFSYITASPAIKKIMKKRSLLTAHHPFFPFIRQPVFPLAAAGNVRNGHFDEAGFWRQIGFSVSVVLAMTANNGWH
jgi:hypothetical protein